MNRTWVVLCILCVVVLSAHAQTTVTAPERNRIGLFYGFGGQSLEFVSLDIQYQYEIRQFEAQYSYALIQGSSFDFDLLATPQINLSRYKREESNLVEERGAEWGITAGISPSIHSSDRNVAIYLLISSGPIYITGSPQRQSRGLNFASNFMAGIYFRIFKKTNLEIRSGFRHLSNAQIRYPNGGLNNLIWSVGLTHGL